VVPIMAHCTVAFDSCLKKHIIVSCGKLLFYALLRNIDCAMGRVNCRVRKPFIGGRRKQSKRRLLTVAVGDTISHTPKEVDMAEQKDQQEKISSSARKLSAFGFQIERDDFVVDLTNNEQGNYYFFAQKSSITSLIKGLLCPECKMPGLSFEVLLKNRNGFVAQGSIECKNCSGFSKESYLCERVGESKLPNVPFDINIRAVLAFRGIGCGYSAMKDWGGIMDMPFIPSQDTYAKAQNKIEEASIKTFKSISRSTREIICNAYAEVGVCEDIGGVLDIAVSYDGSWQKRGYTSHNCVASVIDLVTGLPIDFEVLSNYCSKCSILGSKENNDNSAQKHAASCSKNFDGSSGAMEIEAALRIWKRSISDHKLRYTTMLCDGDSKAFEAVRAMYFYGKDKEVVKEDCINHVSKRMGTALMNIVASSKAQKEPISGKGKLTMVKIKKIQNYYGRAIKDYSDDVPLLKKRIMAILLHLSSTDKMPKHVHCPPGSTSWCFWQRAIAQSKEPPVHADHETLPLDVGTKLVPIFQRLSDEKLLKRCSRRATQNANEALHQLVWKVCPKSIHVRLRTLRVAATLALAQFSMGASFKILICKVMGMDPGRNMEIHAKKKDFERIQKAEEDCSACAKSRRKKLKYEKLKKDDKKKCEEGETYSAGSFNT